jgi:hypothetical protein
MNTETFDSVKIHCPYRDISRNSERCNHMFNYEGEACSLELCEKIERRYEE